MLKIILLLTGVFSLSFSAYSKECKAKLIKENLCVKVEFLKPANRKEAASFKLIFKDSKGRAIMPKPKLEAKLWMVMKSGHGHGSEELKLEKKKDHYLVSNAWFMMLGTWSINIKLVDDKNKAVDSTKYNLCIRKESTKNTHSKC